MVETTVLHGGIRRIEKDRSVGLTSSAAMFASTVFAIPVRLAKSFDNAEKNSLFREGRSLIHASVMYALALRPGWKGCAV